MNRRILAALLGLTGLLLVAVVVPLGIVTADHDRQVFTDRAIAATAATAAAVEERLADARHAAAGRLSDPAALGPASALAVFDDHGREIDRRGAVPVRRAEVAAALRGRSRTRWADTPDDTLLVVLPVRSRSRVVGAVALARAAGPLEREVRTLAISLAGAAIAVLCLAAAIGVALARWVSTPLRRLEAAAGRLGTGTLEARAGESGGPPEVRQLARAFDDMAARLETLVHGHRALIADVSHQLRTPLAALRLRLELLDGAGDAASEELAGALAEVQRLSRLVDGLLAIARAEHTASAPVPIAIPALLADRAAAWRPVAAERQIGLELQHPERLSAQATPDHLEQVLDNLIANALDATPIGGTVSLTAAARTDGVRITVADTGPGMDTARRSNALRRFWTDSPDADRGGCRGSGLGLAIAHRLLTVDGGQLTLDEAPGGGLAAHIDLHRAPAPRRSAGQPAPQTPR